MSDLTHLPPQGNLAEIFPGGFDAEKVVETAPKMSAFASRFADKDTPPEHEISLEQLIDEIRGDTYKAKIKAIRKGNKALKNSLPAITASGTFTGRSNQKLIAHSGILIADIDLAENPQLADHAVEIRERLQDDPHVVFFFESPSGGLKVGIRIEADAEKHRASFDACKEHLRDHHGVVTDEACKDVARLCFLSHDPDAWLNDDAVVLPPVEVVTPETTASGTIYTDDYSDTQTDPELVRSALMAIPRQGYDEWLKIASSVWSLLGEAEGTALLKECHPEEEPGEYEKKFPKRLTKYKGGTLFHIAEEIYHWKRPHGVKLPEIDPETRAAIDAMVEKVKTDADATGEADIFDLLDAANIATDEKLAERRKMETESVYAMQGISIVGEWLTIYASYSTGKTLLTIWLIIEAIKHGRIEGKQVYYLNADDTFSGTNEKGELLKQYGIREIVPGSAGSPTCAQIVSTLAKSKNAHGKIVILDTLKKFTDLMDKKIQKKFGEDMRQFITSGGTLIGLAHTNKHKDGDGKAIASGTSDISDDCDCKFILDLDTPKDADDRQVTFTNDKPRGPVEKQVSFKYDASASRTWMERFESVQRVSEAEAEATVTTLLANEQRKQDQSIIEYIAGQLMLCQQSERDLTQNNLANPDDDDFEERQKTGSRAKRKEVLHRYDQSNPDPLMRYWLSFKNSKGGTSYKLPTKWDR